MSIRVSLCCNDERGNHSGRVDQIQFETEDGYEMDMAGPAITCNLRERGKVGIGRRRFKSWSHRSWVGNIFWEGFDTTDAIGLDILRYLFERGWEAEGGTVDGPFARVEAEAKGAAHG